MIGNFLSLGRGEILCFNIFAALNHDAFTTHLSHSNNELKWEKFHLYQFKQDRRKNIEMSLGHWNWALADSQTF